MAPHKNESRKAEHESEGIGVGTMVMMLCLLLVLSFWLTSHGFTCPSPSASSSASMRRLVGYAAAVHDRKLHVGKDIDDEGESDLGDEQYKDLKLEAEIDAFLQGEYDQSISETAPKPNPFRSPSNAVESALKALRRINSPHKNHGAAVLQLFLVPLSRAERWGSGESAKAKNSWKEVLRGALTPDMLTRRIRASDFAILLEWQSLEVTEGYSVEDGSGGLPTLAFVNAEMRTTPNQEPTMIQFTLRKVGEVWLIDKARLNQKKLFQAVTEDDVFQ